MRPARAAARSAAVATGRPHVAVWFRPFRVLRGTQLHATCATHHPTCHVGRRHARRAASGCNTLYSAAPDDPRDTCRTTCNAQVEADQSVLAENATGHKGALDPSSFFAMIEKVPPPPRLAHVCAGTTGTRRTSAPGTRPHLRQDSPTSAPIPCRRLQGREPGKSSHAQLRVVTSVTSIP